MSGPGDGLVRDRRHASEGVLAAPAVLCPLDSDDDREPKLVASAAIASIAYSEAAIADDSYPLATVGGGYPPEPAPACCHSTNRCRGDGADPSARSDRERVFRHSRVPANGEEQPMPAPPVIEIAAPAHHLSKGPT